MLHSLRMGCRWRKVTVMVSQSVAPKCPSMFVTPRRGPHPFFLTTAPEYTTHTTVIHDAWSQQGPEKRAGSSPQIRVFRWKKFCTLTRRTTGWIRGTEVAWGSTAGVIIAVTGRHVSNKSKNCFRLFSIVVKTVGEPDWASVISFEIENLICQETSCAVWFLALG